MSNKSQIREDQSEFVSDQEMVQAPPDVIERGKYRKAHEKELKSKKWKWLAVSLGIVVIFSLIVTLITLQPEAPLEEAPQPTPTPRPIDPTALEAELERIREQVELADPLAKPLIPPPVDMDVDF